MLGSDSTDSQTPRLDAFDEEFARERVAILRGQRRWKLRFAILIIGQAAAVALARPQVSADGGWRLPGWALRQFRETPRATHLPRRSARS
jgi:hypothetical protein